jgi:23S rRNA pseudouridine2604 synthase
MAWTRRYDEPEPQRVNRWLAQSGVCSRREAEALIAKGLVSIDGERVDDPGRKIVSGQTLSLADDADARAGGPLTIVLNKPVGVVSSQPEDDQVPAVRLVTYATLWGESETLPGRHSRLAPVGRLDKDSRGLLILSEDGVVAKAVIGPASDVEKDYLVQVAGPLNHRKIRMLRHGLRLDGRDLKPARVDVVEGQSLRFILKEGRNRQIRRMCEMVELAVVDLQRIRVGGVTLGDLPEGRWRPMTAAERSALVVREAG